MSTKRKNHQIVKRQVRRVLNRMGDAWVGTLSRAIYRFNYGRGLTKKMAGI